MVDNLTEKELLNYAIENGIIDINTISKKIEMNERKKYLEMHEGKVWQGKDGKWRTYFPDNTCKNGRKTVKRLTKESVDDAIVDFYKAQANEPYIEQVFYQWVNDKISYGEISKQSYDRYETDFKRFFGGSRLEKVKFRYITEDILEDFIKRTIHDKKLTSKAWGGLRILINGIFKYGKKKKYTELSISQFMGDLDLSSKAFAKKQRDKKKLVFTDEEIGKIVEYIYNNPTSITGLGILLAFQTGLRPGELVSLKWSDVGERLNVCKSEVRYKQEDGTYQLEVIDSTKTEAGMREVVLTDEARKLLKQIRLLNPFGEYIFMENGKRKTGKAFTNKMYRICDGLGIERRSLNKTRKTYATHLINGGVDEVIIKEQMGHTEISTTKKYYYFNNQKQNEEDRQIKNAINY